METAGPKLLERVAAPSHPGGEAPDTDALLRAYHDVLSFSAQLPAVTWLPRTSSGRIRRHIRVPRLRLFLRYFLHQHMHRTLGHLQRRYYARAALNENAVSDQAELKALENFQKSLPAVPPYRYLTFLWIATGLVLAFFLMRAALGAAEDTGVVELLRKTTKAILSLSRGDLVAALEGATWVTGPGALVGLAIALWLVLALPITSFRLKRILFNLHPNFEKVPTAIAADHIDHSGGIYMLESQLFKALGGRRPREVSFDLFGHAVIMVPLLLLAGALTVSSAKETVEEDRYGDLFVVLYALAALLFMVPLARLAWIWRVAKRRDIDRPVGVEPALDLATKKRRMIAFLVDAVPLAVLATPIWALLVWAIGDAESGASVILFAPVPLASLIYGLLCLLRRGQNRGQTIGKSLLRLRVARSDGEEVEGWRMLLRESGLRWLLLTSASLVLLFIPTVLNYLWPRWDRQQRTLHDIMAGTVVVRR
jgi:uncharacterized RDD family membrane protein YckC